MFVKTRPRVSLRFSSCRARLRTLAKARSGGCRSPSRRPSPCGRTRRRLSLSLRVVEVGVAGLALLLVEVGGEVLGDEAVEQHAEHVGLEVPAVDAAAQVVGDAPDGLVQLGAFDLFYPHRQRVCQPERSADPAEPLGRAAWSVHLRGAAPPVPDGRGRGYSAFGDGHPRPSPNVEVFACPGGSAAWQPALLGSNLTTAQRLAAGANSTSSESWETRLRRPGSDPFPAGSLPRPVPQGAARALVGRARDRVPAEAYPDIAAGRR